MLCTVKQDSLKNKTLLEKRRKREKRNGRTQNNKTKSYIKEKKDEHKSSHSYATGTCSCGGYRLVKSPRPLSFIKGAKFPIWPAKWGCFATNIGWRFSLEIRKEQEVNHILKVHFFSVEDVFVSTYFQCLTFIDLWESPAGFFQFVFT